MSNEAPVVFALNQHVAPVVAGSDQVSSLGVAPFDGTVTKVTYMPDSGITGVNTNTRNVTLQNRGTIGSFQAQIATIEFDLGVAAVAWDELTIPLTASVAVAKGDDLTWASVHVGTGLADPGGLVHVEITKS